MSDIATRARRRTLARGGRRVGRRAAGDAARARVRPRRHGAGAAAVNVIAPPPTPAGARRGRDRAAPAAAPRPSHRSPPPHRSAPRRRGRDLGCTPRRDPAVAAQDALARRRRGRARGRARRHPPRPHLVRRLPGRLAADRRSRGDDRRRRARSVRRSRFTRRVDRADAVGSVVGATDRRRQRVPSTRRAPPRRRPCPGEHPAAARRLDRARLRDVDLDDLVVAVDRRRVSQARSTRRAPARPDSTADVCRRSRPPAGDDGRHRPRRVDRRLRARTPPGRHAPSWDPDHRPPPTGPSTPVARPRAARRRSPRLRSTDGGPADGSADSPVDHCGAGDGPADPRSPLRRRRRSPPPAGHHAAPTTAPTAPPAHHSACRRRPRRRRPRRRHRPTTQPRATRRRYSAASWSRSPRRRRSSRGVTTDPRATAARFVLTPRDGIVPDDVTVTVVGGRPQSSSASPRGCTRRPTYSVVVVFLGPAGTRSGQRHRRLPVHTCRVPAMNPAGASPASPDRIRLPTGVAAGSPSRVRTDTRQRPPRNARRSRIPLTR